MKLIDTHAHLNDDKFSSDLEAVVKRAEECGVYRIIVCGYNLASSRNAVKIASQFDSVYATVGIHPHDAKTYNSEAEEELLELAGRDKVLAIGEIGLDFHYNFSNPSDQIRAFESQIELAGKIGLPVVVHSREARDESLAVLKGQSEKILGCVFHCFSGDEDFARHVLDMGYYIGVDGPVTYKGAEKLRAVVSMCPLDRLLIETDCPYLAPMPFRGKRKRARLC